jgi:fatty acid desaturase
MTQQERDLWFAKKEGGGIAFLTWQAKFATALYVVLILFAIVLYSQISLIALVVVFYTIVYGCLLIFKSDIVSGQDHE